FNSTNWFTPVYVTVHARADFVVSDTHDTLVLHTIDPSTTDPLYRAAAPGGTLRQFRDKLDVVVVDDSPGLFVRQSDGSTLVTLCGNAACTIPGPGDSYTVRLTSRPTANVQVQILTDGQTNVTTGGAISTATVGTLRPAQLFSGNVTVGGPAITLASGSELGSFVTNGFIAGPRIRVAGTGAGDGDYYIASVTPSTITLTTPIAGGGTFSGVGLSALTEDGTYTGTTGHTVTYDAAAGTLTRDDGTSWLDSKFIEGQQIQIGADPAIYKIGSFSSAAGGNLNVLKLTRTAQPAPGSVAVTTTVNEVAPVVTFTTANWYVPVTVPLLGDVDFPLAPGRGNLKVISKQPHTLSNIRGPLMVEGGTTTADRSLKAAVLLPGEGNGPVFGVAPQPPEWQQIDTLNIYNDGSRENGVGTLTSTALTGFGMGQGLDFSYLLRPGDHFPFGEPGHYPGGISYG